MTLPVLGCLLVAALALAGVGARFLPHHTAKTAVMARTRDTTRAGGTARASDSARTAATTRAKPAASPQPQVTGGTIAATGGGAGAAVADLSQLTPVQVYGVSGLTDGPVRIGATTYADSVRFTCDSGSHESSGDLDYVVTGYGSMTATLGIPSYDTAAAGDIMTVSFNNNGTGQQASNPVMVTPGHPQQVKVRFEQASQLVISCTAIDASGSARSMDLALGNAVIRP
jgi:hypothetical protein